VFFTPLFYWAAMTYLGGARTARAPQPVAPVAVGGGALLAQPQKEHRE
jgi:hypothetical protein